MPAIPAKPAELPPRLVFLDLETTGGSPRADRVTEIALIVIEAGTETMRWSSLVNPGCAIPPDIQWLTGITNEMVADAPRFAEVAAAVQARLDGEILVAHNARFDYGFLKGEFARLDITFSAKTLCTAKLSRQLFPQHHRHNLDTLIERHQLQIPNRHRAMGDTEAIVQLMQRWQTEVELREFAHTVQRVLKRPSLPKHLPLDVLQGLPRSAGVYSFYGLNEQPLYIGKSVNVRERVATHFTGDYLTETDTRLSEEVRRIEVEETAGEMGALLIEAQRIKERMPTHNAKLRKKAEAVGLQFDAVSGKPRYVLLEELDLARFSENVGFFNARRSARSFLAQLVKDEHLCAKALGLEKGAGPCFSFQIKRCHGWCVQQEGAEQHLARVLTVLVAARAGQGVLPWPRLGAIALIETSSDLLREDWHVFDQWCYLGTVRTREAAADLARAAKRVFELDAYRLVMKALDTGMVEELLPGM